MDSRKERLVLYLNGRLDTKGNTDFPDSCGRDYACVEEKTEVAIAEIQGVRPHQEDAVTSGFLRDLHLLSEEDRLHVFHSVVDLLEQGAEKLIDQRPEGVEEIGSTLSAIVVAEDKLYGINVGDSTAFFITRDASNQTEMKPLYARLHNIRDLKYATPIEQEKMKYLVYAMNKYRSDALTPLRHVDIFNRIESLSSSCAFYLAGKLQMYRSIGDLHCRGDGLTSTPDVTFADIEPDKTTFVLNACDGLTEVLSPFDVGAIVKNIFAAKNPLELAVFKQIISEFDTEIAGIELAAEPALALATALLSQGNKAADADLELCRVTTAILTAFALVSGSGDNISVQMMPVRRPRDTVSLTVVPANNTDALLKIALAPPSEPVVKYLGLADGHNGDKISKYLAANLGEILQNQIFHALNINRLMELMSAEEIEVYGKCRSIVSGFLLPTEIRESFEEIILSIEQRISKIKITSAKEKDEVLQKWHRLSSLLDQAARDFERIDDPSETINTVVEKETMEILKVPPLVKRLKIKRTAIFQLYADSFISEWEGGADHAEEKQSLFDKIKPELEQANRECIEELLKAYIAEKRTPPPALPLFPAMNRRVQVSSPFSIWLEQRLIPLIPADDKQKFFADNQYKAPIDIILNYAHSFFPVVFSDLKRTLGLMIEEGISLNQKTFFINTVNLLHRAGGSINGVDSATNPEIVANELILKQQKTALNQLR